LLLFYPAEEYQLSETGQHCDRNAEENNGGDDDDGSAGLRDYLITFVCKGYLSNCSQRLPEF